MATSRNSPYPCNHFLVDLGTGDMASRQARFCRVELPEAQVHAIAYRGGGDRTGEAIRLFGLTSYGRAILQRGVDGLMGLYEWWDQARNGDLNAARNITVVLLDDSLQPVLRWRLDNARPAAYRVGALDALSSETLIETIELEIDRLEAD